MIARLPRRRVLTGVCAAGLLVCLICLAPAVAFAQPPMDFAAAASPDEQGRVRVVVELAAAPVVGVYLAGLAEAAEIAHADAHTGIAAATATAQLHLATVETQQAQTLAGLRAQGVSFEVLYRNQRVYNGMGLILPVEHLATVAALPDVVAIHPLSLHAPTTSISAPHIHADALWAGIDGAAGLTGAGIRIAVIDTGIDYLHTAFGGPGIGYSQNNAGIIGDAPNFPGVKVVGGWDFAGDAYNADPEAANYSPIPQPNPDPMDCYAPGHGTHVAAIAAGYGVTAAGATYAGPYNTSLNAADFRIGPGIAPHAQVYALKVFGCRGKTSLVDAAIEWAVDPNRDGNFADRMDVINLSLGSGFGAAYDSSSIAADNAARLGVVVVASAGNNGDTVYAVGSPGVAESVISTAATSMVPAACPTTECPLVDLIADFSARGPRRGDALLKPDLAAPGLSIVSANAQSGDGAQPLSGTSMAAPHVAGAAALLLQSMQAQNGASFVWQPGDIKARLMNTAHRYVQATLEQSQLLHSPVRMGAGRIDLQAALSAHVIAYDAAAPTAVGVSFGAPAVLDRVDQTRNVQLVNRGAYSVTFAVRYEALLATPGVTITLAAASPVTVPVTPDDSPVLITVPPYGVATVALTLEAQADAMVYTRDPTLPAIVTFPRQWLPEVGGFLIFEPPPEDDAASSTTRLSPTLSSSAGVHPPLHLPVYAAPQPVANLQALPQQIDFGQALSATRTIEWVGHDLTPDCAEPCLAAQTPLATASIMELHHTSGRRSAVGGLPPPTFEHADLQYVGAGRIQDTTRDLLYFGIATHGSWSTLNEVEFNIWLDTDGDRQADYRLFNSDYAGFAGGLWSEVRGGDVFIGALENLATGERVMADFVNGASAAGYVGGVYNTNVILLSLPVGLLAMAPDTSLLHYRVTTYSRTFGNHPLRSPLVDNSPWLQLQLDPPALMLHHAPVPRIPSSPLFSAQSGAQFRIDYRVRDYAPTAPPALLIFHHTNAPMNRVAVLPIRFELPFAQFLPLVEKLPD